MNKNKRTPCIQKITNDINGKIYVGQTVEPHRRFYDHIQSAKTWEKTKRYKSALYHAMNYYGTEHFHFEIIEECDLENLSVREQYWIETLCCLVPDGQNILNGGKALYGENNPFYGKKHTEDTKLKISLQNTGRVQSDEEREMRRKINSGQNNPFYGKHHSDATKQKIKEQCIQNEIYQKASERMRNNNPNDGSYTSKKTVMFDINFDILNVFNSATEAGRWIKEQGLSTARVPSNSISDVCRGNQRIAYGYYWRYIDYSLASLRGTDSNQFIVTRKDD